MSSDDDLGDDFLGELSLLELFRAEVEAQTAVLSEGLLVLEQDHRAVEGIEELMRAAHSLKGAAGMVRLAPAVELAHAMEDCFIAAQKGELSLAVEQVDLLLAGVDALGRLRGVGDDEMEGWLQEHGPEFNGLARAIRGLAGGGQAAVPAAEEGARKEGESSAPAEARSRAVRITPESLNRLMGLAGEALVETRWLEPFARSLLQLKRSQSKLTALIEGLQEALEREPVGEEARRRLEEVRERALECRLVLTRRLDEVETFARRSENLSGRLYREAIATRMRPFADGVQGFPRMVRDLARKLGKKVRLEVAGKNTPVDRDILEKLETPINHMLRNAVDHGIETPQERVQAGKVEEGRVRLEAQHAGGMLSISVSDDGRGVDLERLRQRVVERGMASAEMAAQLSETELMDFLFLPNFSTAARVTDISGRGVGLDAVRTMVQEVGGVLHAASKPGRGMEIHLQLPLTLSVVRTLLVEIAGEPYAFPLARVDRTLKVDRARVEIAEGRQYCRFGEQAIGLVGAHQVLELEAAEPGSRELCVVVVSDRLNRYGLVVDRFLGESDLVVRPLDPRLGKTADIGAAALLEDGSPVLILDVDDMVRSIDGLISGGRLHRMREQAAEAVAEKRKRILVVDDSITVREVERKLLENGGYEVEVAVDGMDGWNAVRTGSYDLVVSDVDMPRMSGIELVRLIRRDPHLQALPVLIVSYKDREEDRMAGLEAGANYYLTKSSFHDASLLNAVEDLIGEA